MIGLDTNVLVRYLVQDDPAQARKATQFIDKALQEHELLFLNCIVLCELVWVLESAYGYSKLTIIDVLDKILTTAQFEIEQKDEVRKALDDFKRRNTDFADCLIGRKNLNSGCSHTVSFDKQAAKAAIFQSVLFS